jgi:hypothetical protein
MTLIGRDKNQTQIPLKTVFYNSNTKHQFQVIVQKHMISSDFRNVYYKNVLVMDDICNLRFRLITDFSFQSVYFLLIFFTANYTISV